MTMYSIENNIQIAATPARVLQALTTHEGMVGWWTTDCTCDAAKREATFRFAKKDGTNEKTFKLVRADEQRVVMTCIAETGASGWLGTVLSFDLLPSAGGTRVALAHEGYAAKDDLYDMCVKGWAFFIGSLKSYVETGVGQPHVRPSAAA